MSDDSLQLRIAAACVRSTTIPLFSGDVGLGKTATWKALAEAWGYHFEAVVGSNRDRQDFMGLPAEHDGMTSYLDVDWARRAAEAQKAIVVFDEFNTGGDVFKAMLRVLGERTVGNLPLPETVSMVALMNPVDIAVDGVDLAAPIANRFAHFNWVFDLNAWLDGVVDDFASQDIPAMDSLLGPDTVAHRAKMRSMLATYLRMSPTEVNPGTPEDFTTQAGAFASPRTWTFAMQILGELRENDEDAIFTAVKGCVGEAAAHRFVAWKSQYDLYDPEWAMDNPDEVDFTSRADLIYALLGAVQTLGKTGDEAWVKAMELVTRCGEQGRADVAQPAARSLLNSKPDDATVSKRTAEIFSDVYRAVGVWEDDPAA